MKKIKYKKQMLIISLLTLFIGTIQTMSPLMDDKANKPYKQKEKVIISQDIHSNLKKQVREFLTLSKQIMEDKISVKYLHNNIINGINLSKNIQYESQYIISSFPKYATVNISALKKEINLKVESINENLTKMKKLRLKIENSFDNLELYAKNKNIKTVKVPLNKLFVELNSSMAIALERVSSIKKGIMTINDELLIDNDNKEIPNKMKLSLKSDKEFYNILKNKSYKIENLLNYIDPVLL